MKQQPLYKIWSSICHEKKVTPLLVTLDNEEKEEIYQKIKNAMQQDQNQYQNREIYLHRYKQPFEIKKWLENEHRLKCYVHKAQVINGHISGYEDTHYCHVIW